MNRPRVAVGNEKLSSHRYKKSDMINGWENRDDYWTNIASRDFDRNLKYRVYLGPFARIIRLKRVQKNDLRMLRCETSKPLRQESAADAGSVLWDVRIYLEAEVRRVQCKKCRTVKREKTVLAGEQSLLHETICLPRGTEVSSHDHQGCKQKN